MNNSIKFDIDCIIEEYSNYVFKIINNIAGSMLTYEDKEEITSDSFYLLWKNQDKINSNLKAYLASIVRNCTLKKLQVKDTYLELEEKKLIDHSFEKEIDEIIIVKEKLKRLQTDEIKIFNLYYVEGLKVKEISKILKLSTSNIKIKLYRIRKKLKEEFLYE